ncbi:MAG: hypothetical protein E7459_01145 [Ruminococcaceae bacterium]|nr:hypothetical protein [Oscillospiraceae bacterium]
MINLVPCGNDRYDLIRDSEAVFRVGLSVNRLHRERVYLDLLSSNTEAPAWALFSTLRQWAGKPLQVMLDSDHPLIPWLISGGFIRKRRCLEAGVTVAQLKSPLSETAPPQMAKSGEKAYLNCCHALYAYYTMTHQPISPLTATFAEFLSVLPETVYYTCCDGQITHYAFIEPGEDIWEVAYVGSRDLQSFSGFAMALVSLIFQKASHISFECDDTDPAAMALSRMFQVSWEKTFDTFIYT